MVAEGANVALYQGEVEAEPGGFGRAGRAEAGEEGVARVGGGEADAVEDEAGEDARFGDGAYVGEVGVTQGGLVWAARAEPDAGFAVDVSGQERGGFGFGEAADGEGGAAGPDVEAGV